MVQAHVFYSGQVQGVGFRFTVYRCASQLGLRGWVRNLADGRVELVAEGDKAVVIRLLEDVEENFAGYIRDKDVRLGVSTGEARSFRIV